jgi:hypothetical protein
MGSNINGPSLIRVPHWASDPLGVYYLYFAHHRGDYIRLAYADRLEGPWTVYGPGTVHLAESYCLDHVASPDVHIDDASRTVRMYYHGHIHEGEQGSKVAISSDGIHFECRSETLGNPYLRVFNWDGWYYGLAMPGVFYRSQDGLTGFERGPVLFNEHMRHAAVMIRNGILYVFYSVVGDCPECILLARIDITGTWTEWRESAPTTVLEPETAYEGVDMPLEPSIRGLAVGPVRQLRDPCVFEERGKTYLLYSVAGEQGIAIAELPD